MAYRTLATAICLLWLGMTGLLIRTELFPQEQAAWLKVPIDRVVEHFFAQGEESELTMYNGRQNYGQINFIPRRLPEGRSEVLYSGSLRIYLPGEKPRRIAFNGSLDLLANYAVDTVLLRVLLQDGEGTEHEITVAPHRDEYTFATKVAGNTRDSMKGSIHGIFDDPMLKQMGIDLDRITASGRSFGPASITAHMDELQVLQDTIPTYRISVAVSPDLTAVIHLSQTGRVLRVDTPVGYTFLAPGLEP